MSKIKYAVVLRNDYTAELRFKEYKKEFVNRVDFALNANYPLTHIKNRQIVNTMLNENGLIVGDFYYKVMEDNTQIIHGDAVQMKKARLFEWSNESGFSLIELAVSCAIMSIISGTAMFYLVPAQEKMHAQIEELKYLQENSQTVELP